MTVDRPLLRYHGGKFLLSPWIIEQLPPHKIYTEPFGGAASVLLKKPRCYSEVYNDMDSEVVNLFRVLRDPSLNRELVRLVSLTPYAREEFELSLIAIDDPLEQARRTLFRFAAGYSTAGIDPSGWGTGFRGNVTQSGSIPAHSWRSFPNHLDAIIDRLTGVVIENIPACELLQKYDTADTLHYCDPPYPFSTRNSRWAGNAYRHEMSDDDHREMSSVLHRLAGMVVISGYPCDLYDQELFPDWKRVTRETSADGGRKRTEVLWVNPAAEARNWPLLDLIKK